MGNGIAATFPPRWFILAPSPEPRFCCFTSLVSSFLLLASYSSRTDNVRDPQNVIELAEDALTLDILGLTSCLPLPLVILLVFP